MLAVVAGPGARLDPGSVALALARRVSEAGEPVLFVDADATGTKMAQRLGDVANAEYQPSQRGLPSLMVCRQPLTLRLLADHCYSLETLGDPLWALFAPTHPAGAAQAAAWLAERADELVTIGAHRRVIVSGRLGGQEHLAPLLQAAPMALTVAPVGSLEEAKALWAAARDGGLLGFERGRRALLVEGESPVADDDIALETAMPVAARLPEIGDERLLHLAGRRDRRLIGTLTEVAQKLLAAWDQTPPVKSHGEVPAQSVGEVPVQPHGEAPTIPAAAAPAANGSGNGVDDYSPTAGPLVQPDSGFQTEESTLP